MLCLRLSGPDSQARGDLRRRVAGEPRERHGLAIERLHSLKAGGGLAAHAHKDGALDQLVAVYHRLGRRRFEYALGHAGRGAFVTRRRQGGAVDVRGDAHQLSRAGQATHERHATGGPVPRHRPKCSSCIDRKVHRPRGAGAVCAGPTGSWARGRSRSGDRA